MVLVNHLTFPLQTQSGQTLTHDQYSPWHDISKSCCKITTKLTVYGRGPNRMTPYDFGYSPDISSNVTSQKKKSIYPIRQ